VDFNFGNSRPRTEQIAIQRLLTIHRDFSIPLGDDLDLSQIITTWMVQLHSNNTQPVYLHQFGPRSRPTDPFPAIEILPGQTVVFSAIQEGRQLYELQILTAKIASQTAQDLIQIPLIAWDLTRWWILGNPDEATESVQATLTAFPLGYL
jgi:hypothetical protein